MKNNKKTTFLIKSLKTECKQTKEAVKCDIFKTERAFHTLVFRDS